MPSTTEGGGVNRHVLSGRREHHRGAPGAHPSPSPTADVSPQLCSQARAALLRGGKARKGRNGHLRDMCMPRNMTATARTRKHSVLTQNLRVKSARGQDRTQTWDTGSTGVKTKQGEHAGTSITRQRRDWEQWLPRSGTTSLVGKSCPHHWALLRWAVFQ